MNRDHLDWPFFDAVHRRLAADLDGWAADALPGGEPRDVDAACRAHVRALRIYEGATEVQKLIIGRELVGAARRTLR